MVRHQFLSVCPMEWESTEPPVMAWMCKAIAVRFVMLCGTGEEAGREMSVLKVPRAGPLVRWSPQGVLPIQLCFLVLRESQAGGTQHLTTFEGCQGDGNNKRKLAARAVSLINTKPLTVTTGWALVTCWREDLGESLEGPGCIIRAAPPHLPGLWAKLGPSLILRASFPWESAAPLPLRRTAFCLINFCL